MFFWCTELVIVCVHYCPMAINSLSKSRYGNESRSQKTIVRSCRHMEMTEYVLTFVVCDGNLPVYDAYLGGTCLLDLIRQRACCWMWWWRINRPKWSLSVTQRVYEMGQLVRKQLPGFRLNMPASELFICVFFSVFLNIRCYIFRSLFRKYNQKPFFTSRDSHVLSMGQIQVQYGYESPQIRF